MSELRLNTAGQFGTYRFVYASTGNTVKTGIAAASVTVQVVKIGTTLATIAGTTTNFISVIDGIYKFIYQASNVDTVGEVMFGFKEDACLPFEMLHSVITVKEWDHKYSTATANVDDVNAGYAQASLLAAVKVDTASTVVGVASLVVAVASVRTNMAYSSTQTAIKVDTASTLVYVTSAQVNIASLVVAVASVRANMGYASTEAAIKVETASMLAKIDILDTVADAIKVDTASTVVAIASVLANYAQASSVAAVKVETASMLAKIDILDTVADTIKVDTASVVVGVASLITNLDAMDTKVDSILVDTGTTLDDKIDALQVDITSCVVSIASTKTTVNTIQAGVAYASQLSTIGSTTIAIWDAQASSYNDVGSMGELLNDAGAAGDPWSVDLPGSYTGLDAGAILSQININMTSALVNVAAVKVDTASVVVAVASLLTNLNTTDDKVDSILADTGTTLDNAIAAVKVETASILTYVDSIASVQTAVDGLTANTAQASALITQTQVNAQVLSALDTQDIVQASEMASLSGADVWNAMASTYDAAGTLGEALNNASAAGDPWNTDLPGAYTAGKAGLILSTVNVNAASTVVAIASVLANYAQASSVAAVKVDTASTVVAIASVLANYAQASSVAAVKVDTASLVVSVASVLANYAQASTVEGVAQASAVLAVKTETASMLAKIDILDTVADAIKVDTASTVVSITSALVNIGVLDGIADSILIDTGTTLDDKINAIQVDATSVVAAVAALNDLSAADVNAQVLDVLNVDTFAEPGQEAPAATNTLAKKIGYLFKFLRNKITQTSTTTSIYNDAGTTVDQSATVTDDGSTFTRGEFGTGA